MACSTKRGFAKYQPLDLRNSQQCLREKKSAHAGRFILLTGLVIVKAMAEVEDTYKHVRLGRDATTSSHGNALPNVVVGRTQSQWQATGRGIPFCSQVIDSNHHADTL
jgi:hypothetical protein